MTEALRVPSPRQVARLFLTPARGKARIPVSRPPGATALEFPFGDGTIAAWEWGKGPTVLLVHGWEGTHADMDHFVMPLVAAGYRVVAFDLPGHGASPGQIAPIPLLARAIRHVADSIGELRGIVAHSIGCAATVTALTRGLAAERVVLISSPSNYRKQARMVARMVGASDADWPATEAELNALGAELSDIDFSAMAPTLTTPALVMHSDDDRVVPFEDSRNATALWLGATFRALSGLGHTRVLGDPDVIADTVDFIKGS